MAVYEAAGKAIERARKGEGPSLIECHTYREYGHFEGDEQTYKYDSDEEIAFHDRDDIKEFRDYAIKKKLFTEKAAKEIEEKSAQDVKDAVEFAKDSPVPKAEALYTDVFAD